MSFWICTKMYAQLPMEGKVFPGGRRRIFNNEQVANWSNAAVAGWWFGT